MGLEDTMGKEEEILEKYQKIKKVRKIFQEDKGSDLAVKLLANYEGKTYRDYVTFDEKGISNIIRAHENNNTKKVGDEIGYQWLIENKKLPELMQLIPQLPELKDKDTLTYEWIFQHKPNEEGLMIAQLVPELKDKDKYKKLFGLMKELKEINDSKENPVERKNIVEKFYNNKIKKLKEDKTKKDKEIVNELEIQFAHMYAYLTNDASTLAAIENIEKYKHEELTSEYKKATEKKK